MQCDMAVVRPLQIDMLRAIVEELLQSPARKRGETNSDYFALMVTG